LTNSELSRLFQSIKYCFIWFVYFKILMIIFT